VILAAYGDQGNCWTQGQPTLCESACAAGLAQSHKAFPAAEVCNHCQTSADCPSSEPACDAATGACVACLVDSDCSSHDAPACAGHRCVACTQDAHCSSPQAPACNTATSTCVQCTKSADCGFFGEVCDPGSHSCRGCQSDAECPGGVCASGQCRQCKTDAQCGGATPRCNKNSVCVGCLEDSDCPTGACNPFTGLCCGAGACEKQGAECGRLIPLDLSCIFSTVSCGSCSDGLACVFNKCIQPPAQKCDSCSGTCAYVPETNSYTCANYFSECDNQSTPKKPCQNGFLCQTSQSSATGKDYSYCSPYCLEDADCLSKKCSPIDGSSGLGTCN
jgi:Cys-rich repeat protein